MWQQLMAAIRWRYTSRVRRTTLLMVSFHLVERAFNRVVRDSLRPAAGWLTFMYGILGMTQLLTVGNRPNNTVEAWGMMGTAVLFLITYLVLRWRPLPIEWAHPVGFFMASLALVNSLLHTFLTGQPSSTPGVLFVIAGVGLFFLSAQWFILGIIVSVLAWVISVWSLPLSSAWFSAGANLGISVLLSTLAFSTRRRALEQYEVLRLQEQRNKQELHTLYQSEQIARRAAETMFKTGSALTSTLNWSEVLDLILGQLAVLVPHDRASMLIRQGNELAVVAAKGFPNETDPLQIRIVLDGGESIFREIYRTQRPLAIADVLTRPDWQQVENLPQARAWLGVPLTHAGEVVGMLSLTRETAQPYHEDEISLATAFAGHAAIALRNATLYEKVSRFNQQLEYEVQQRTEALHEAYERLERLDRAKSDFINITSHELRTPLTVLKGYSQMMLKDKHIQENERYIRLLSGILAGSERMEEIVNSMLEMAKIDSRALELYPEPLSVPALIQLIVNKQYKALTERNLTLHLEDMDDMPLIEADPEALQKVFRHLIINAIKYTPDGGTITISGGPLRRQGLDLPEAGVEIVIRDTGIGIDSAVRELIFTKFYQTGEVALHSSGKTAFKAGGPGLGLAIARGIVEAHRGKIWAESQGHDAVKCPGSQFHVVLPLRQN